MPASQAGLLCAGQVVTITGTHDHDVIGGTASNDVTHALDGEDEVRGLGGADVLFGGAGDDLLLGGYGSDAIDGNDTAEFAGAVAASLLTGTAIGEGADTLTDIENLTGSPVADIFVGDENRNNFNGMAGPEHILAQGGDDVLIGMDGADDMVANAGNDVILGGAGNDIVNGNDGDDVLDGGSETDVLDGEAGKDVCFNAETKANCETSLRGDADTDGCTDAQEQGLNPFSGGQRNVANFWDFYDVPVAPQMQRNRRVTSEDIFALLGRFGSMGAGSGTCNRSSDPHLVPNAPVAGALRENYHPAYDRGPLIGPDPLDLGPPDGSIAAADMMAMLAQFGHACVGGGGG